MDLNGDMDSFQAPSRFQLSFCRMHISSHGVCDVTCLFLSAVYKVSYLLTYLLNLGESRPTNVFMNAKAR